MNDLDSVPKIVISIGVVTPIIKYFGDGSKKKITFLKYAAAAQHAMNCKV